MSQKISTYQDLTQLWPWPPQEGLPPGLGSSQWSAAEHFRTARDAGGIHGQRHAPAVNKTHNMSSSRRQTPCIDYHVKQHSRGTDLKTSQRKNADMRSVQERAVLGQNREQMELSRESMWTKSKNWVRYRQNTETKSQKTIQLAEPISSTYVQI